MSARRGKRNQVRKVLVGIILATLPCYCIGLLIVNLVDSGGGESRPTATASLTTTAPLITLAGQRNTDLAAYIHLYLHPHRHCLANRHGNGKGDLPHPERHAYFYRNAYRPAPAAQRYAFIYSCTNGDHSSQRRIPEAALSQ